MAGTFPVGQDVGKDKGEQDECSNAPGEDRMQLSAESVVVEEGSVCGVNA